MEESRFWSLVAAAVSFEEGERIIDTQALEDALLPLSNDELRGFETVRAELMARSYTTELWGAAYLLNGGCSDDGFEYFRAGLILLGRELFERVLKSPDELADIFQEEFELEDAMHVASDILKDRTGEYPGIRAPYPELAPFWDFDDAAEMSKRYPKLSSTIHG